MKNKLLIFISFLLFIYGCTTTAELKNAFSKKYTGLYLFESQKFTGPRTGEVYFDPDIDLPEINPNSNIKKRNSFAVPLVFVNYWQSKHLIYGGKKLISEDIDNLIYENIIKESERSGQFNLNPEKTESSYQVKISVDSLEMFGQYSTMGYAYFLVFVYGFAHHEYAGPGYIKVNIPYSVYKDGISLCNDSLKILKAIEGFPRHPGSESQLQRDFAISMVETFSECVKYSNVKIVQKLNKLVTASN